VCGIKLVITSIKKHFSLLNCISVGEIFFICARFRVLDVKCEVGAKSNGGKLKDLRDWVMVGKVFVACDFWLKFNV